MASTLSEWKSKPVTVLTCDGRLISGTLRGYDQLQNLVLQKSYETVYSRDSPPERIELGLFVVRGDNVAVITNGEIGRGGGGGGGGGGGVGEEVDDDDGDGVRAEPIKEIAGNR
jgi:U6 snRNA-associated Sm-like protein LSm8